VAVSAAAGFEAADIEQPQQRLKGGARGELSSRRRHSVRLLLEA
jgi:hypothetical protein